MRTILRVLVCAFVFGVMLGGARHASAYSAEATDAAFGALLSMPGTQPTQGQWIVPEEYAAEIADEAELIEQLRQSKRRGADFNALRHRGTLLAHAIRAGLDRTALWLLKNGADPRHVLFDRSTTAYDLALKLQRPDIARVLERDHGFTARQQAPVGARAAAVVEPAAPASRVDEAVALMRQLVTPYPDKARQETWQRFAATLSETEFVAVFKDGANLESLIRLSRSIDGALEESLARLPVAVVRQKAQQIADLMGEMSYVSYAANSVISYTPAARAWPALWQRIEKPLHYDERPDLAERIPPGLWPGLFASGYAQQDAALTGCLLATVDLPAFKALWPDFQRYFSNARQEAPTLVLGNYRPWFDPQFCAYGSSPAQTIEKLSFLRQQGVQAKVRGVSRRRLAEQVNPALDVAVGHWLTTTVPPPELLEVLPRCELALNEGWLDKLINTSMIGWGIPAESVRIVEVPGYPKCGLAISGSSYSGFPEVSDNFGDGPFRESWPSCPDAPDDSEIWIENAGGIQLVKTSFDTRGALIVGQVKDVQSGKIYLLYSGAYGTMCSPHWSLPQTFEWEAGILQPARDEQRIARQLAAQCEEQEAYEAAKCRGFLPVLDGGSEPPQGEAVFAALRNGGEVRVISLIDAQGVERRRAYAAAIAARDRVAHRTLLAAGIPPHWTVAEIIALGKSDLPLEEKRRRIALLFSNSDQLDIALNSKRYDLPEALLSWLPRQDWGPVWRVIGQQPDMWWSAAKHLREKAAESGREELLCDIDRAQGFLCGGGIELNYN